MIAVSVIAELCVYILTWNVADKLPDRSVPMYEALALNGSSLCPMERVPDIIVVGLQEVSTKLEHQIHTIFKDDPWTFWMREHFANTDFVKVETEDLQGMLIMLFAQRDHIAHMRDIETSTTATGIGGFWGNKGAVSIRLSLYGIGVTFVNTHLAAHVEHLNKRLQDYRDIVAKHHYNLRNYPTIMDHEFIFWFGDLNFRLSGDLTAGDISAMVANRSLDDLLKFDQLIEARHGGYGFVSFREAPLTFAPTYKFVKGTSEYDLSRTPAWCDRIMYRSNPDRYGGIKLDLQQLAYRSYPDYMTSDHKPVSSTFVLKITSETGTDEHVHERTHGAGTRTLGSAFVLFSMTLAILLHAP